MTSNQNIPGQTGVVHHEITPAGLSPNEQRIFNLYGKLPSQSELLKRKDRKYFDSGDYALSKAGKSSNTGIASIGSKHPEPEDIPHQSPPPSSNGSPTCAVHEPSLLLNSEEEEPDGTEESK